jgi:hypothetical protein
VKLNGCSKIAAYEREIRFPNGGNDHGHAAQHGDVPPRLESTLVQNP